MCIRIFVFVAALGIASAAHADTILKEEPHVGMLRAGHPVLVDNGKCPAGKVQEVSAGETGRGGVPAKRTRRCVQRP
jgi:hypothetical protein